MLGSFLQAGLSLSLTPLPLSFSRQIDPLSGIWTSVQYSTCISAGKNNNTGLENIKAEMCLYNNKEQNCILQAEAGGLQFQAQPEQFHDLASPYLKLKKKKKFRHIVQCDSHEFHHHNWEKQANTK